MEALFFIFIIGCLICFLPTVIAAGMIFLAMVAFIIAMICVYSQDLLKQIGVK